MSGILVIPKLHHTAFLVPSQGELINRPGLANFLFGSLHVTVELRLLYYSRHKNKTF